jgi:signal transduction histidine kinase
LTFVTDITDRKKAEESLLHSKNEIEKALVKSKELNDFKSRIIASISHEYRTPLTVISTSAEILKFSFEKLNKEAFFKNIGKIHIAVKRMINLLEGIILAGKLESGQHDVSYSVVNIRRFMEDVYNDFFFANKENHQILLDVDNEIELVQTDERLLKLILSNLISNSVKFSQPEKPIILSVKQNSNELIIKLKDEGVGILPDDIPKIFEPFYTGKNIDVVSGTGFGLTIVKGCVDLLNGKISVESNVGAGTTITVILPK